jgi:hypothetical protein
MLGQMVPNSRPYSENREPLKTATRRTGHSTVYLLCDMRKGTVPLKPSASRGRFSAGKVTWGPVKVTK